MPKRARQEPSADQGANRPVFLTAARQRAESRRTADRPWSVPLKRGSLEELLHARKLAALNFKHSPDPGGYSRKLALLLNELVIQRQNETQSDEFILSLAEEAA